MAVQQLPIPGPLPFASTQAVAGIIAIVTGAASFAMQDVLMKVLLEQHTLWFLIETRLVISIVLLCAMIALIGGRHTFISINARLHFLRGFLMSLSFAFFYSALPSMSLAAAATIAYAFPLFVTIFAVVFFGERIGMRRIFALLTGFTGVVVTMRPGSGLFELISILPLASAFTYAISIVLLRRVGDSESSLTVALHSAFWFALFIFLNGYILSLVVGPIEGFKHLDWVWTIPMAGDLPILLGLGLCGFAGLILISRAYQIAPASFIAPFDYAYLGWAALFSFLFWDIFPSGFTLVGMFLIVGAGVYVGRRELLQLRRVEAEARAAERVRDIV